ncbi:MBL fold metallo-hydrolase [Thermoproteota archaeon]
MKNKSDSIQELFSLTLGKLELAFMYVGYSGVILRTIDSTVAFDVADLLKGDEIRALENLNLLLFTHSHGDHYKPMETLEIFRETGARIVAEPNVAKDLKGKIPSEKLTSANHGITYSIDDFEITVVKGSPSWANKPLPSQDGWYKHLPRRRLRLRLSEIFSF